MTTTTNFKLPPGWSALLTSGQTKLAKFKRSTRQKALGRDESRSSTESNCFAGDGGGNWEANTCFQQEVGGSREIHDRLSVAQIFSVRVATIYWPLEFKFMRLSFIRVLGIVTIPAGSQPFVCRCFTAAQLRLPCYLKTIYRVNRRSFYHCYCCISLLIYF